MLKNRSEPDPDLTFLKNPDTNINFFFSKKDPDPTYSKDGSRTLTLIVPVNKLSGIFKISF